MSDFTLTKAKIAKILDKSKEPDAWFEAFNAVLPKYEINTTERVAAFLAQCGHESAGFTVLQENLNYSASGLASVFKKYFTTDEAAAYARQPERIANRVYGGRMGNGPESSGEGYKFRGRGIIQLTGKENYTNASKAIFNDDTLVKNPDMISADKKIAVEVACWFWKKNGLNALADTSDIKGMTKRINGGYIGLDDRIAHYNSALAILKS
jgi:putative chitinase